MLQKAAVDGPSGLRRGFQDDFAAACKRGTAFFAGREQEEP